MNRDQPHPSGAATPSSQEPGCERCGAQLVGDAPCSACILEGARRASSSMGGPRAAFEAPSIETLNAALPAYEFQLLIGQGGMGAVYRARHRQLDRMVAIKVLRPMELADPVLAADFTERFEREARVLAKLDHPHIVRIYDFGRADSPEAFFYLALEYVDGANLRELMGDGRLSPKDVLELVPQVCEALQTAHALGIIHRDIKPENILVDSDGRVKIADFGLAKLSGLEPDGMGLTQSHQTFGSLNYMAPEQMRSAGAVDHRADLYSLGVVVYEMLTGELPIGRFAAPSAKAGTGLELDNVVFRALENEPDERYQGAEALKDDLVAGEATRAAGSGEPAVPVALVKPRIKDGPKGPFRSEAADQVRKRREAEQAQRLKRQFKNGEPGAKAGFFEPDAARTWAVTAALLLTYSMDWVGIPTQFVSGLGEGQLTNGSPLSDSSTSVVQLQGYAITINSIPLWIGILGVAAAALLRSLRPGGKPVSPHLLAGLGAVGTALTILLWVIIGSKGIPWDQHTGYAIAILLYWSNSVHDVHCIWRARDSRRRWRRKS